MMKRRICLAITLCFCLCCASLSWATDGNLYPSQPALKAGQKMRIGYLEGGAFPNYPPNLMAFVQGLASLGWLAPPKFPDFSDLSSAKQVWDWLADNTESQYLVFVKNGFYSVDWDKTIRKTTQKKILERLGKKQDIDFMMAMGTWAGQDLANNQHQIPTMVFSASDPIGAKIIESADDSGFPHLTARVDPTRYERQVRLFNDIVGFQTLGVAFEDTPEGRTYAAIDSINQVAKELGFEVITCPTLNGTPDIQAANASVNLCHEKLADKVQALYITNQTGVNASNMPALMAPLLARKIPTFSQPGADFVRLGALMSIAQAGFVYTGEFHAKTAGMIFNGANPGDLPQVFEDPPKISLNLETATRIGYNPSVEILVAADEIYKTIESPKSAK